MRKYIGDAELSCQESEEQPVPSVLSRTKVQRQAVVDGVMKINT